MGGASLSRDEDHRCQLCDAARNKQEFSNELHSSHAAFILFY